MANHGNVTGFSLESTEVLRPSNRDEVRQYVLEARQLGRPLYPVSTGLNWGYGSSSPVKSGCALLDLSAMNSILNAKRISLTNPVAVIEPGVTQAQLHHHLKENCPELMFNVTGSAAETSIIGNALDRGVGYLGPRREDVFGLEFVTGTGQLLQTGFRRMGDASPLAHCHPYGLGPMLDGLLFQGNFGVVTSACFKLVPRPARQLSVSLALRHEANLGRFINALAQLKREHVMSAVTHIANKARTHASLMFGICTYLESQCRLTEMTLAAEASRVLSLVSPHQWTSLGGLAGSPQLVDAALAEVKGRMRGLARVTSVDDAKLALGYKVLHRLRCIPWARANAAAISAIRPLHGLATGIPTDAAINNLLWRFGQPAMNPTQLDESRCGLLFISPALPMDGEFVADVAKGMSNVGRKFGHELYMTLNIETENSLVAVVNLLFERTDAFAVENAKRCATSLHTYIKSRGLEVYRARADMMSDVVDPASEYWQAVRDLKSALDPDNIIAPGRYNLVD
ncbi:MAG TPA: FAD-binding oxidoreductase [Burkholderiales bacterium]|nr:FAD-binding oxidoreductase [Burkholderiales bacterium]